MSGLYTVLHADANFTVDINADFVSADFTNQPFRSFVLGPRFAAGDLPIIKRISVALPDQFGMFQACDPILFEYDFEDSGRQLIFEFYIPSASPRSGVWFPNYQAGLSPNQFLELPIKNEPYGFVCADFSLGISMTCVPEKFDGQEFQACVMLEINHKRPFDAQDV